MAAAGKHGRAPDTPHRFSASARSSPFGTRLRVSFSMRPQGGGGVGIEQPFRTGRSGGGCGPEIGSTMDGRVRRAWHGGDRSGARQRAGFGASAGWRRLGIGQTSRPGSSSSGAVVQRSCPIMRGALAALPDLPLTFRAGARFGPRSPGCGPVQNIPERQKRESVRMNSFRGTVETNRNSRIP